MQDLERPSTFTRLGLARLPVSALRAEFHMLAVVQPAAFKLPQFVPHSYAAR